MKKYVVTSLVALSVASITGLTIGLAINRPVQLTTKAASSTLSAPTTTTATSPTSTADTQTTTTSTAPTQSSPATTSAATTTTTTPVTVTAFQQIPLDAIGNIDCMLTYSDGTTYQWHWQTYIPQYQWVVSRNGVGTWESTTQTLNDCDQSVVGTAKQ